MSRRTFIAGNWKMNTTIDEAVDLAKGVVAAVGSVTDVDVAVCPPYTNLSAVAEIVKDTNVKLGAQDVHWEEKGAYTGKISCAMLKALGVELVIVGHSEQRTYFGETDETVNKKVAAAIAAGLGPIVCVGETLDERNGGNMETVVERQVRGAFAGMAAADVFKCVVAYEPVWAIGTGVNATAQQANDAHIFIRKILADMYDDDLAQTIVIQYGGSMKPANAKELLGQSDVDGGLIGGASLKAADFAGIVTPA
ncbi:MAG: triose-phosphate isomerase [Chitinivibrionales bacterium]|nr:triose-phosphate isomerase [Chitinivibrionales bacterium]MBD3396909.1 triose-phosphate isomerase [Chitinivibrionales bacterium]